MKNIGCTLIKSNQLTTYPTPILTTNSSLQIHLIIPYILDTISTCQVNGQKLQIKYPLKFQMKNKL